MKKSRNRFALATSAVVLGGLALTACFTANLSGSASSPSPIVPLGASGVSTTKKVEFSLSVKDSMGMGIGGANGALKDSGINALFPKGVKISFRNGLSIGAGMDCTDIDGGPSRRVHGVSTSTTNPADNSCTGYADPRFWLGVVTYSSADPKLYPNQGFAPCNDYYQSFISEFAGSFLLGPVRPKSPSGSSSENISGFGVVTIVDTNYNRNYDHGDRFGFVPVCGPYTHLDGSGFVPVAPTVSTDGLLDTLPIPASMKRSLRSLQARSAAPHPPSPTSYGYISCGGVDLDSAPMLGGAVLSSFVDENPYIPALLSVLCAFTQPSTGGDLKIGIGTRLTTTTTIP